MKIIGINGKKRTGKDTLCNYLLKCAPISMTPKRVAFADPLKEELAEACGVSLAFLEEHKDNFRMLLQGWGTDFRRKLFTETYWVDKVKTLLLQLEAKGHHLFVIPDVRFLNEFEFVKSFGGIVIHITRNIPALDTHESERSLGVKFDYEVDNNGDIYHLEFVANSIITKHFIP